MESIEAKYSPVLDVEDKYFLVKSNKLRKVKLLEEQ